MAHAQKPDFLFRRNGRVHLNKQGRQFSRLLAAEVCASAVVMLDVPRSSLASPCAIRFQMHSTNLRCVRSQKNAHRNRTAAEVWKYAECFESIWNELKLTQQICVECKCKIQVKYRGVKTHTHSGGAIKILSLHFQYDLFSTNIT